MENAIPLEIERKYLIRMPDERKLDSLALGRDWIEQTYLTAEAGTTERVRSRRAPGGTPAYTHTGKRRMSAVTREEREEEISREEYEALLRRADSALQVIRKTRWRIPYEGHTLEIDRFPFWTDRALLEVELRSENEAVTLPDWIALIREVTEDEQYTNRAMAASVPYEKLPGSAFGGASDPMKRSWAEIDLRNIEHNYRTLKARLPEKTICLGVVKADSYGHGALPVARRLQALGCGYLAVATPDEAAQLRAGGIRLPILILGPGSPDYAADLADLRVTQAVGSLRQAKALSAALRPGRTLKVHAKLETGMGRTGFPAEDAGIGELVEAMALPGLDFEGVFTHFAMADVPGDPYTAEQYERFRNGIAAAEARSGKAFRIVHCANSGAVIHTPLEYACDMARPGIALYGYFPDDVTEGIDLRPVMALKSRVAAVTTHKAGDTIGYGRTYTCPKDMRIAVLPLGYADGLHRSLSNKLEVELCGVRVKQIGRICMDLCMLDVTDLPEAQVGSVATVFGGLVSCDELAAAAGTISYELCCAVSPRIPRVYLE